MLIVVALSAGAVFIWYHAGAKALMDGVVLYSLPTIAFLVVYFIIIDVPMLGGPDILDVKGIEAEHEFLKFFLAGLPVFLFVTFYLETKGLPLLMSLAYSLICWVAAFFACLTFIILIVFIGTYILTKFMGQHILPVAIETPPELKWKCPNCHQGIPIGSAACPFCGVDLGANPVNSYYNRQQ